MFQAFRSKADLHNNDRCLNPRVYAIRIKGYTRPFKTYTAEDTL